VVNLLSFAALRDQISRSEQEVILENIFSYEDDLYIKDVILSSKSKGGYFEDINLVNQNMILLRDQKIDPISNTYKGNVNFMYGSELLGNMTRNGVQPSTLLPKAVISLAEPDETEVGKKALIEKDPHMCITLPTWLKFWQKENPVILYTFRNPVEVARSIVCRDRKFFDSALRSWIIHNKHAILSSANLCLQPCFLAYICSIVPYASNFTFSLDPFLL